MVGDAFENKIHILDIELRVQKREKRVALEVGGPPPNLLILALLRYRRQIHLCHILSALERPNRELFLRRPRPCVES